MPKKTDEQGPWNQEQGRHTNEYSLQLGVQMYSNQCWHLKAGILHALSATYTQARQHHTARKTKHAKIMLYGMGWLA